MGLIHLTSVKGENPKQRRAIQLKLLYEQMKNSTDCIIFGDFNFEEDEKVDLPGFKDIWVELHPEDKGYTFNPQLNTIAKVVSTTEIPKRFDRILLRSKNMISDKIQLCFTESFEGDNKKLHPSDHFGLECVIKLNKNL